MKVGIMQPYLFPYLGYWQLMNAVDTYVICDDVNYIKNGWINRNNIKINGETKRIGIQIHKASQNKLINELSIIKDESEKAKLLKTLECAYKKAPYFEKVYSLVEEILDCESDNLSEFLTYQLQVIANYLEITPKFLVSSKLDKNNDLKKQDMVIDICKNVNADFYINAIGGSELYNFDDFKKEGIDLAFLKMDDDITYNQGKGDFIPSLSIIDVMMYNSVDEIKEMLNKYTLVRSNQE